MKRIKKIRGNRKKQKPVKIKSMGSLTKQEYALGEAAQNGELETVKSILENPNFSFDINTKFDTKSQRSLLMIACEQGHVNIAKYLLEKGADINTSNKENLSVLYLAVQFNYFEIVKFIIEQLPNKKEIKNAINKKEGLYEMSPFYLACTKGYTNIAKLFLKNGADVNAEIQFGQNSYPVFYSVILAHHLDIAEMLVKSGCNIDKSYLEKKFSGLTKGYTHPFYIVSKNSENIRFNTFFYLTYLQKLQIRELSSGTTKLNKKMKSIDDWNLTIQSQGSVSLLDSTIALESNLKNLASLEQRYLKWYSEHKTSKEKPTYTLFSANEEDKKKRLSRNLGIYFQLSSKNWLI